MSVGAPDAAPATAPCPTGPLRLHLRCEADALEPARLAMRQHLEAGGVDAGAVYRCELVLEELLLNIARHTPSATRAAGAQVSVELQPGCVVMRFVDHGPAFDPTLQPDPQPPESIAQAQPGGLGLLLVRRLSCTLAYRREGDDNHVEVRLARAPAAA